MAKLNKKYYGIALYYKTSNNELIFGETKKQASNNKFLCHVNDKHLETCTFVAKHYKLLNQGEMCLEIPEFPGKYVLHLTNDKIIDQDGTRYTWDIVTKLI